MADQQQAPADAEEARDPNSILFQHYQMDLRARGSTLGIGRRIAPSSRAGFSEPAALQTGQFGSMKPKFSQGQNPENDA